ncbi:MAG: hypothetical protein L0H93_07880 [Nocardioides sp.]|nr:hypothetical protein [Nocardioides sp.]
MTTFDTETVAVQALSQARLLRHRADLAASTAESQAVTLLLRNGMSQRAVARLAGLSKSDVARRASAPPPLGVATRRGADRSVFDFADEWIWGSREIASAVSSELLRDDA